MAYRTGLRYEHVCRHIEVLAVRNDVSNAKRERVAQLMSAVNTDRRRVQVTAYDHMDYFPCAGNSSWDQRLTFSL